MSGLKSGVIIIVCLAFIGFAVNTDNGFMHTLAIFFAFVGIWNVGRFADWACDCCDEDQG